MTKSSLIVLTAIALFLIFPSSSFADDGDENQNKRVWRIKNDDARNADIAPDIAPDNAPDNAANAAATSDSRALRRAGKAAGDSEVSGDDAARKRRPRPTGNDRRGDGRKDRNDRNDRDEDKTYLDRFGRRVDKDGRLVDQYGRYVDSRGNLVGNLFADQLYPKNWSLEKAQGRRAERRLSGPIRYVRGDGDDWRGVLDRVSLGLLADYVGWRDEYNRGKWDTRQEAMFRYVHDNVLISFRTVRNPTKSEWNAQARIVLSEYLDKNATEISLNDGNYRVMFADRSQNPGRSEWYDTSVSEIVLDSRDEVVVIKNDSEGSSSTSVRGPVSSGVTVIVRDR